MIVNSISSNSSVPKNRQSFGVLKPLRRKDAKYLYKTVFHGDAKIIAHFKQTLRTVKKQQAVNSAVNLHLFKGKNVLFDEFSPVLKISDDAGEQIEIFHPSKDPYWDLKEEDAVIKMLEDGNELATKLAKGAEGNKLLQFLNKIFKKS